MKKFLPLFLVLQLVWAGKPTKDEGKNRQRELREEIVVVAEKTQVPLISLANSVENLTAQDFEKSGVQDLKEALQLMPSAYIPNHNSHGIISSSFFRGVSSSRGIFALEGIPMVDPNSYTLPLDFIPAFFLSSVQMVMGPQSSLWGDGAMGFASFLALDRNPSSSIRVMAGGMSTLSVEGKTGIKGETYSVKGGYSYFNTAGVAPNNRYKRNSFYMTSAFTRGNFELNPYLIYTNQLGYIPFRARGIPAVDRRARDKVLLAAFPLSYQRKNLRLTLSPYYFYKSYIFTDPNDPWGMTNASTLLKERGIYSQAEWKMGRGVVFTAGGLWRKLNLESKSNLRINYLNLTPYYLDSWANLVFQGKRFFFSAGGGFSHSKGYGDKFSPKVSSSFWLTKNLKIRASYSQGFRFPSPSETWGPWGNPLLKPEESEGYEGGMDIFVSGLLLSFTSFKTEFKNLIVFDFPSWKFSNLGRAKLSGWETKGSFSMGSLSASLSLLRLTARDLTKDEDLLRRPQWLFKTFLGWSPSPRATLSLFFVYVGKRKDFDDLNWVVVENPAYKLVNFMARYRVWKDLEVFFRADNILNENYQDIFGYPSPGRTLYGGMEFGF